MKKRAQLQFKIEYTRPVPPELAGAVIPGDLAGLAFERAPDELTARFQFGKRIPTAIITKIEEIKP